MLYPQLHQLGSSPLQAAQQTWRRQGTTWRCDRCELPVDLSQSKIPGFTGDLWGLKWFKDDIYSYQGYLVVHPRNRKRICSPQEWFTGLILLTCLTELAGVN
jgi:hypothetical protein